MSDQSTYALRRQLKRQRAQLTPSQQHYLSKKAVEQLYRIPQLRAARNIALYLPVRGEADPRALLPHLRRNQRIYLPVLSPSKHNGLVFVRWTERTRFKHNKFRIPEPLFTQKTILPPAALDVVITPLLGFDTHGSRLGMGGGFYDRSFACKRYRRHTTRPYLIGFAYEFQQVEPPLERQAWDVPLDAVVTEVAYRRFTSR